MMARTGFAQIQTRIWRDADFLARSAAAQRLYMLLLSQPNLNAAGVLPRQVRRWSNLAPDTTVEDVQTALAELAEHHFVVVDEDTEEVLIRSYMRNDELWRQPNVMKSALGDVRATLSASLRASLRVELERIPFHELDGKRADEIRAQVNAVIAELPEPIPEPQSEPLTEPLTEPFEEGVSEPPVVVAVAVEGCGSSSTGGEEQKKTSSSSSELTEDDTSTHTEAPPRPDVERICTHLADRIVANGSKRPTIGKRWRSAARLMLDRDGRTEEQVHRAIDWCQDDEFWRANIQSMSKLREKYDQLRLAAQRQPRASPERSTTSDRVAGWLALADSDHPTPEPATPELEEGTQWRTA